MFPGLTLHHHTSAFDTLAFFIVQREVRINVNYWPRLVHTSRTLDGVATGLGFVINPCVLSTELIWAFGPFVFVS